MNPAVMGGKPVIRGTRVPVEMILRKLGAGLTPDAVLADRGLGFGEVQPLLDALDPVREPVDAVGHFGQCAH